MRVDTERAILRTVLFADLHQYSRLVATDESGTVEFVTRSLERFREQCEEFGGEFIKTTGDGVVMLFDSASAAIDYAMTVQARMRATADGPPQLSRFRIGLHMGEVLRRGADVYGHAVNLAARVEAEAQPGGVCVTQEVYSVAHGNSRYGFRFAGRTALKNIPEPVSLYHVTEAAEPKGRESADHLLISVIDGISISSERGELLPIRSQIAKAVLGYLALSNRQGETLDRVAALIWPDKELARARRSLGSCVKSIEDALSLELPDSVLRRGDLLSLSQFDTEVDLSRILGELHMGNVDDLLLDRSDWPESILRGLEKRVSPLFDAWLSVTRHNWRERVCEALEANLERFEITETALRRAAMALLRLEPTHERAARRLMRHYAAVDNAPAALRVYNELREIMQTRFSLAPSKETDGLIREISVSNSAKPPTARRQIQPAHAPVVAVGQFVARSDALVPAASGFRAELIANLSKFRELTITEAHESSAGVDYLLTAECIETLPHTQLFVRLSEPGSARVIWGDSFSLSLGNWSEAQQRVVSKITSSLEIYLSQDRLTRTMAGSSVDLGTYDAWLRGEHLLTHWSAADEDEAAKLFERVIDDDPDFAPAHASLANVYNSRHFIRPGISPDPLVSQAAFRLAERAVELDPLDARNHLTTAWTTAMLRRFEQSEVHYELAAKLNPNNPKTLISASLGLAFMGRQDEAMGLVDRALSLTPQLLDYQWSYVAPVRYFAGDLEGAVKSADLSKNRILDTPGWKAAALLQLGRREEARAAFSALCDAISAAWAGQEPPSPKVVLDWFTSAFPIRREEDRKRLTALSEFCQIPA